MRQFYNENGSIAYREYIDEDEHVLCLMMHVYTVNKHSSHTFIRQLRLNSEDIIIIDRATDVGQAILENKGSVKLA